jgi:N5-(carboxyethyl)ornithine synthase
MVPTRTPPTRSCTSTRENSVASSLVIDVSCDEGMGFFFAKPITFREPMFKVGKVDCCAVDLATNFLWESASRLISAARVAYMDVVLGGPAQWKAGVTIRRAINTDAGVVQMPHILWRQGRSPVFPHELMPELPLAA